MYHVSAQGVDEGMINEHYWVHLHGLHGGSVNIYTTEALFPLSLSSSGCIHVGSFFTNEEKNVGL